MYNHAMKNSSKGFLKIMYSQPLTQVWTVQIHFYNFFFQK